MTTVFIDAAHLVAIFEPTDALHETALTLAAALPASTTYVTTDLILGEFLASVSRKGDSARTNAAEYVGELLDASSVSVVMVTEELFRDGLALYRARPDKRYSLTDCVSMVVCRARRISDVLTSDADFAQEGFAALLV